ncbi:MAG: bifunctional ornithine acetyltransferase/N-acetylglutamate synthase, partial [Actinobacteria bacterium]|nr:bifunctional ornithine acetyltransferase/N-acetylglutamate synthase [Actinomycetota bacterium]
MSVTAAKGYVAGAVAAGIRRRSVPDLAVVASIPRATGAAMFTTNRVQAAPVKVSRRHIEVAEPQAVVVNSGVANAATGPRGELDALATASETARLLSLRIEEVLVLSTGLIGAPLPLARVRAGLASLIPELSSDGGLIAAEAIMTTDTRP